ncbi:dephospho-CoA kinase [Parapedobacter sp. 10938]|uniref:dephospho-CoA kinase n=1 Tax=Parapedobacter flavus TaxID=3110225 RepID=UPI002DBC1C7B|nr:dephospho-CoA kinase [Parapedobacter sp. 10938]MEC3879725.1 dephospho-CoA kinase [Parapedobacter sp. 10938]
MPAIKVGVTGGIGSGKSVVCRVFQTLGIPVFDADREAKLLMATDSDLMAAIRSEFGDQAYHDDGSVNRGYLASQVFNDPQRLERLNGLVHPVAIRAGEEWAHRQEGPYSVKEAALLFESGSFKLNDYTILVTAPEDVRIARVVQRDGVTPEQVRARMQRQWPDEEKARLADLTIVNDGKQAIIPQVLALDRFFRAKQS